jgi:hypothetical protein
LFDCVNKATSQGIEIDRALARSFARFPFALAIIMISNFFVLSPRGDTIIFKQYRTNSHNTSSSSTETTSTAHERSNTEAFFRKIKFWDDTSMMTFSSMNALDSYMTQQQNSNLSNQNNAMRLIQTPAPTMRTRRRYERGMLHPSFPCPMGIPTYTSNAMD